jgi:hypothetical protein
LQKNSKTAPLAAGEKAAKKSGKAALKFKVDDMNVFFQKTYKHLSDVINASFRSIKCFFQKHISVFQTL